MQSFELSGTWRGFYEYGPKYSKSLRGKRVEFFLNIKANNDEFFGDCIDVSEDYRNNLKAEIRGFIDKNLISFIKRYPYKYITKEDGSKEINYDENHPEIEYTGYYEEESGRFAGEWLLVTRNVITNHDYSPVIPYNNSYYDRKRYAMRLKEYVGLGTWEIQKEEV